MQGMVPAWLDGVLDGVEKLKAHQRGLQHKAVSVFVLDGPKVLIQRRALGKYHTPGLWANTCCTHPLWDRVGIDCARRRLAEEMGISGFDRQPMGQVNYRADVGAKMEARWAGLAALRAEISAQPQAFALWLRIYLERHARVLFG